MTETHPIPSDPLVQPEVGELMHVTFWHATGEIDVAPVSAITHYPAYPNDDCNALPAGLNIYVAPTKAITERTFQDYCALYLAAGAGTFTLMELGQAVEIPFITVWETVKRLHKTLPEDVLGVDMKEPLIRKRTVTLGNVAVAEVKRAMEPEELKAREEHRHDLNEKQAEAYQRQISYRQKPKILELQYCDEQKRQLRSYDHVVLTIRGNEMRLDLTTPEGRLAFRYIEGLKKLTTSVITSNGNRLVTMRDVASQAWKNMTIAERLDYVTELGQLYSRVPYFMDAPFTHVRKQLHHVKPDGVRPITTPHDRTTFLFTNPPVSLAFSQKPPQESSSMPPLVISSFPEKIATKLPKTPIEVPDFSPMKSHRHRGHHS